MVDSSEVGVTASVTALPLPSHPATASSLNHKNTLSVISVSTGTPVSDSVTISSEASMLKTFDQQYAERVESQNSSPREQMIRLAGDQISKMKSSLEQITKMYPPYPVGSDERAAHLNQYGSLRREIDRMTFPAPRDSNNNRKGWMWDDMFRKDLDAALPPQLDSQASDEDVAAAVKQLSQAETLITRTLDKG